MENVITYCGANMHCQRCQQAIIYNSGDCFTGKLRCHQMLSVIIRLPPGRSYAVLLSTFKHFFSSSQADRLLSLSRVLFLCKVLRACPSHQFTQFKLQHVTQVTVPHFFSINRMYYTSFISKALQLFRRITCFDLYRLFEPCNQGGFGLNHQQMSYQ